MKVVAIVQARMGSSRLPRKVMRPIQGLPLIELLLDRLSGSAHIDQIVLATSEDSCNDELSSHVRELGYEVVRGDEQDVLSRYWQAAQAFPADLFVRITGDCPLIDPSIVDAVIENAFDGADYFSNVAPPTFPDGLDVEVFTFDALGEAANNALDRSQREHVTPYIRESGRFNCRNHFHTEDLSGLRWTVDEPVDFEVVSQIFEHFAPKTDFSWKEVLRLKQEKPYIFSANQHLIRNEGATMSKGQKLWKRAKQVIPGGNMLLSKRPEMFLPEKWPTYFQSAKGSRVTDLDGNEYIDMSIMGVGTNILGYGQPEVDDAVRRVIDSGNMSTLNCPEEVYLAERLVELHPWADMARFARAGGEANTIAIRIARAASGKDKVAICGYHGWHDWYLSTNLADNSGLDVHLLPGLEPRGVPRDLAGITLPFAYNDIAQLEQLFRDHSDLGVVKMEVSRNEDPAPGFLERVRELATQNGAVLVFDECTSGFRETFGGLHKKYGVEPDMALFGKALGNGYAISSVIGRREVMEAAQSTFISSTFWTERIGPAAALKTLEVMEREHSWDTITRTGLTIRHEWKNLAERHGLEIEVAGLPALSTFSLCGEDALAYKTLITQEMLTKGYLAGTAFYACTEHTQELVDGYVEALDGVFALVRECEEGRDIKELLKGPVCHAGFKRLN